MEKAIGVCSRRGAENAELACVFLHRKYYFSFSKNFIFSPVSDLLESGASRRYKENMVAGNVHILLESDKPNKVFF